MSEVLDVLEIEIGESEFLADAEPTIADFTVFPIFQPARERFNLPFGKDHRGLDSWYKLRPGANSDLSKRVLMSRFQIEKYDTLDVDVLGANRDQIYALELTLDGQACSGANWVLAEPNAFGIPVRKAIVDASHVPFLDQKAERDALPQVLRKLYNLASGRKLRLPRSGIGAGPHGLAVHSSAYT